MMNSKSVTCTAYQSWVSNQVGHLSPNGQQLYTHKSRNGSTHAHMLVPTVPSEGEVTHQGVGRETHSLDPHHHQVVETAHNVLAILQNKREYPCTFCSSLVWLNSLNLFSSHLNLKAQFITGCLTLRMVGLFDGVPFKQTTSHRQRSPPYHPACHPCDSTT